MRRPINRNQPVACRAAGCRPTARIIPTRRRKNEPLNLRLQIVPPQRVGMRRR